MHIATRIYTFLFGQFVGKDEYGNSYFRRRYAKPINDKTEKRWVIYNGLVEATKVPPLWHRWLHFMSDHLPSEINITKQKWHKAHQPNFTATSAAYSPYQATNKQKSTYQTWQPNEK